MLTQRFSIGTLVIGLSAFLLALSACSKNNSTTNNQKVNYTLSGNGSGAQEVPAVMTQGTGTVAGTYNSSTKVITYTVTWSNLSGPAAMMHFHGPAAAGENANVTLPITGFSQTATGTYSGTATLTSAQETDLLAGKWYYNVHTAAHGSGEIRAQVAVQ